MALQISNMILHRIVGLFCKYSLVSALDVSALWILGRELVVVGAAACVVVSVKKSTMPQRCVT